MKYLSLIAVLFLAACATAYNGPAQKIEVVLKDANAQARCYLENEDLKQVFSAPAVISVQRSKKDLVAYCRSANGKEAVQIVPSSLSKTARWNFFNLYSAVGYDLANRTAYAYPEVIEIDFAADSETIYTKYPAPSSYSQEARENYQQEIEDVLERARALLSQGTPFKVNETKKFKTYSPE